MQKELNGRQAVCILITFLFGSSLVIGVNTDSGQDSWITVLFSIAIAMPVFLVYARIIRIYPDKDIYDIVIELFGKLAGKIIIILITWYSLHLSSIVVRNFSEFIEITALPETPQFPIGALLIMLCVYLSKKGVHVIGKWSIFISFILTFIITLTFLLSLNIIDISYIKPVMSHSLGSLIANSFKIFSFPFAETVIFLSISSSIQKQESPYKIYTYSALIGGFFLLLVVLRNILILGSPMMKLHYFSSYTGARIINAGDSLSRIEGTISLNLMLSGVTKLTLCLLAASKGIGKIFNIQHDKCIIPIGLISLALSTIIYVNAIDMFEFMNYYTYYAFPFQIIIPFLVWIFAEIKTRKNKNSLAEIK